MLPSNNLKNISHVGATVKAIINVSLKNTKALCLEQKNTSDPWGCLA